MDYLVTSFSSKTRHAPGKSLIFLQFLAFSGKEVSLVVKKSFFDVVHFWSTFEGTLLFGNAVIFLTRAMIFGKR